jgi:hypothetical protein
MNKRLFRAIFELVMCRVDYAHQHATMHMRQEHTRRWQAVGSSTRRIAQPPEQELIKFWKKCMKECEVIQNHIKALEEEGSRDGVEMEDWPWSRRVPLAPWEKTRWMEKFPDYTDQWWRFLYPHIVKGAVVEDWDPSNADLIQKFRDWYRGYRAKHGSTELEWSQKGVARLAKLQLRWWWKHTFAQFPPGSSELPWKDILTAL